MTAERSTRPRGRPRTGVREAIMASAQQVLAESGVARLSTKEVAGRAGVAESSIFYHFGDRTGLLQAVIQEHLRPLKDLLAEGAGIPATDPRSELESLLTVLENFFVATIPVVAAIQSDAELRAVHRQRSRDLDLGPHRAIDAVLARFDPAAAQTLRPAALLLAGAAYQRALQRDLSPPDALAALPSVETLADTLLPLFRTARTPHP